MVCGVARRDYSLVRQRSIRFGLVGVMWSTGPEATVKLKVGIESVEVADVMGNRRPLATPGGVATIPLTPMPQYLLGASVVLPAPQATMDEQLIR